MNECLVERMKTSTPEGRDRSARVTLNNHSSKLYKKKHLKKTNKKKQTHVTLKNCAGVCDSIVKETYCAPKCIVSVHCIQPSLFSVTVTSSL